MNRLITWLQDHPTAALLVYLGFIVTGPLLMVAVGEWVSKKH